MAGLLSEARVAVHPLPSASIRRRIRVSEQSIRRQYLLPGHRHLPPELLQLLTPDFWLLASGFGHFSYRKSRRQASTEAITPTKSANRPVGIACRVFVMPTEPK
jgi:hypothetical protein